MIILIFLCVTLGIILTFTFINNKNIQPREKKINQLFQQYHTELNDISEQLKNMDYELIRWDNTDAKKLICSKKTVDGGYTQITVEISNSPFFQNIEKMGEINIVHILKESNYIMFVFWSSLDASCGLIYCQDEKPIIYDHGKTKLNDVSAPACYYFTHQGS